MKMRNVLETIWGSPGRVRILRVLSNSSQPLSGRQIGELAGLTHKGAIEALESLVELGAVKQRRVGRAYQYSLHKSNYFVEKIIVPSIKTEEESLDVLKEDMTTLLGKSAASLMLFGSLARGEAKRGSDIDVLVLARDEEKKSIVTQKAEGAINYFNQKFNALLSVHCYTIEEIRNKKNLPLIKTIMQEGILLSGKHIKDLLP